MDAHPLVGTWRLVTWEARSADDEVSYPFGRDAIGYIIYSADGYMSVVIMRANRPIFATGDLLAGSIEERAEAAAGYISYVGRYEMREGMVIHYVEASLFPNWIGSIQERFCEFVGNRLSLSTAPILSGGIERRQYLLWERIADATMAAFGPGAETDVDVAGARDQGPGAFAPGDAVIWWKRIPGGNYVVPVSALVIGITAKRVTIRADDDGEVVTRHVPPESLQRQP